MRRKQLVIVSGTVFSFIVAILAFRLNLGDWGSAIKAMIILVPIILASQVIGWMLNKRTCSRRGE